jgi:polar amino acid transport system substrate-binding protein
VFSAATDGEVQGFEVDIGNALASRMGVRSRFVQADWSTLLASLERGTFDIAMNGIEVTPARSARVAFSRAYYIFGEQFVQQTSAPPFGGTLAALRGLRVGTLSTSLAHTLLVEAGAEPVLYDGVEEPFVDASHGRTDGVLLDDLIVARYTHHLPNLRVAATLAEGQYAIAFRPEDTELRRAVDDALGAMVTDGELESILRKWSLWNDRQRSAVPTAAAQPATAPQVPTQTTTPFGMSHLLLFGRAALVTVGVSTAAMALAIALGLALAVTRLFAPRPVAAMCALYIELVRGTPVLLQLYLLYFGLAPFVRLDAFTASVVGLGLNYAAYEAEAYRGGLSAVPDGQLDAALVMGMSLPQALRRVVLPQAVRFALPNVTNDFIALLKDSSLVSVITVVELTKQMTITAVDVRSWLAPSIACASLYLLMSVPLGVASRRLERRLVRA